MTGGHDGTPQALGAATTSRGGSGDRGAVAVEFAILFPVLMLLLVGFFEFGVAMTEKMQLVHVVQVAAELEAAGSPGTGLAWARSQLPPPTSFAANPAPPCPPGTQGAQIAGQWPVSLIAFSSLTLSTYANACWPIPPTPPPPPTQNP
jgi:hypothetical protein